ncbi:putative acetyltransferase [Microbacterium halimionae]|uniref:Putative acetyltransferase n=1 Tax=Microbacterium halimionae TaxID=1526413 RepID=A0A7W3JN26_9MICO|nr:GNAT family N-acetyltransferase [Microbacterium halimionae]MBA8815779.1 putative acetyltransferase [Microbacterium halimionae]NII95825.1 putative acetyltransferase [Microbacterium halimionae]
MNLTTAHHDGPVDQQSSEKLARRGLELRRMSNELEEFEPWFQAVSRGFLDAEPTDVQRDATHERFNYRRLIGVIDSTGVMPEVPVGTFASWMSAVSLPGEHVVTTCAISDVTVAPTHRRRGIARAMMEGELRRAAAVGIPMATLTVTESNIYGRYGFAPAATAGRWIIDAKRASWIGPDYPGRLDFISRADWRERAPEIFERVRPGRPGEAKMPGGYWDRFAGTRPDVEKPGKRRAVQYTDTEGVVRGVALYAITENKEDFTKSHLEILSLISDDDEAHGALWRFFIDHDLIGEIRMDEGGIDDPVLWMISDQKAAKVTLFDHHYLRILDLAVVLASRTYATPGRFVLDISDPLDITGGRWMLDIDASGAAEVSPAPADVPVGVTQARMGIGELGAIMAGQVSAATLAAAGRIETTDAVALARAFSWHEQARLSFVY